MELNVGSLAPEVREIIASPSIIIEANTYRTRAVVPMTINGEKKYWHSLKGGNLEGRATDRMRDNYEIFFNPETQTWLKLVPADTRIKEDLTNRLRTSVDVQKQSLIESGLTQHAGMVKECTVVTERGTTYGFTMPHLGSSVEFLLSKLQTESPSIKQKAIQVLSDIYTIAFEHAANLFLNHGMWADDVNPGNILLNTDDAGKLQVVLIDFSNKRAFKDNGMKSRPQGIDPTIAINKGLQQLIESFISQCKVHGIPFSIKPPQR